MNEFAIEKLDLVDYEKCGNIWNMAADPHTEPFRKEMESGNRVVYIYKLDGEFVGEIATVYDTGDRDYTIPNRRLYVSRLIVKPEFQNRGIGGTLIDFVIDKARRDGYEELTIGVDKDNSAALRLYRRKGFTTVLFDGRDEGGEYLKLLKTL